jgi:hypothetical protein
MIGGDRSGTIDGILRDRLAKIVASGHGTREGTRVRKLVVVLALASVACGGCADRSGGWWCNTGSKDVLSAVSPPIGMPYLEMYGPHWGAYPDGSPYTDAPCTQEQLDGWRDDFCGDYPEAAFCR